MFQKISESEFTLVYRVTGKPVKWTRSEDAPIGVMLDVMKRPEFTERIKNATEHYQKGEEVSEADLKELERYNDASRKFWQKLIRSIVATCDPEFVPEPAEDKLDLLTWSISAADISKIQDFFLAR
mgnify:CR=1 FL=1